MNQATEDVLGCNVRRTDILGTILIGTVAFPIVGSDLLPALISDFQFLAGICHFGGGSFGLGCADNGFPVSRIFAAELLHVSER